MIRSTKSVVAACVFAFAVTSGAALAGDGGGGGGGDGGGGSPALDRDWREYEENEWLRDRQRRERRAEVEEGFRIFDSMRGLDPNYPQDRYVQTPSQSGMVGPSTNIAPSY